MNASSQLISSIESILMFLAAFPALWISGRVILRNLSQESRFTQILLWLALGGLILIPLTDFLSCLSSVVSLLLPPAERSASISVVLGTGPYLFYATLTLLLGIAVYILALSNTRRILSQGKSLLVQAVQLRNWELGFVSLGIVGLINRMVRGVVVGFVSIYLPSLTTQLDSGQLSKGFWISWLVAFLILLVTLFVMNERIYKRENESFQ